MGTNNQNPMDDETDMQVTLSLDDGSEEIGRASCRERV